MKLEFETIGELEQFLMFSAHIGRAFATAPTPAEAASPKSWDDPVKGIVESSDPMIVPDSGTTSERSAETVTPRPGAPTEPYTEPGPDTPRRKRRTKAEMEAERAAAAGETVASVAGDAQDGTSAMTSAGTAESESTPDVASPLGNPFAMTAAAIQTAIDTQQTAPAAQPSIYERAGAILADPAAVESIAHLRACQGFIQKHGMPKYNESFTEGLNANIAAYSPEQRALHLAILESFDV